MRKKTDFSVYFCGAGCLSLRINRPISNDLAGWTKGWTFLIDSTSVCQWVYRPISESLQDKQNWCSLLIDLTQIEFRLVPNHSEDWFRTRFLCIWKTSLLVYTIIYQLAKACRMNKFDAVLWKRTLHWANSATKRTRVCCCSFVGV